MTKTKDFPAGEPGYDELVEVLARHIHDHLLRDDGDGAPSFDHMYSSAQQIAAAVLEKLSIMKRIGTGTHSTPLVFTCAPKDFATRASENRERGCSYETVVLALLALSEYHLDERVFETLARLGFCAADGDGWYVWTEKEQKYLKEFYPRWTTLIA